MAIDIQHVVLLLLENRSFDHILGDCPNVEGVRSTPTPAHENALDGQTYKQEPGAGRFVVPDPHHELEHVMVQLSFDDKGSPNAGFVRDYVTSYPNQTSDDDVRKEIMRYHQFGSLSALHQLASEFTVCDRWHASVPGPTWANRLFAMTGTSLGRVSMPEGYFPTDIHWYDQPTIFDRLNDAGRTWNVYYGDFPLSFLLVNQREPRNVYHHRKMTEFYSDAASTDPDVFPNFAFIEPAYFPPHANDDHPPHDVFAGDQLIANVYNALRANAELWSKTLLVVAFDEHGGFYDHVEPPGAVAPDHHNEEYSFLQYGVRVPVVLVSPWVKKGDVCGTLFDHTSLLKYMTDLWRLGALGERVRNANTFRSILADNPRTDAPTSISASTPASNPSPTASVPVLPSLTGQQKSLLALSHLLEVEADENPSVVTSRNRQLLSGPQPQIDVACDRVDSFVSKLTAKMRV
jgi:phospholipase C